MRQLIAAVPQLSGCCMSIGTNMSSLQAERRKKAKDIEQRAREESERRRRVEDEEQRAREELERRRRVEDEEQRAREESAMLQARLDAERRAQSAHSKNSILVKSA